MVLFLLIYIIGIVLCYGIATWLQCVVDEFEIEHTQPMYEKSWHSKATLIVSAFSWLGVILCSYTGLVYHGQIRLRYSYQPLWNIWIENNYNKL